MKILNLQTLKGPNYWSIRRQNLVVMHLDLEEMDEVFSDEVRGFYDGLVEAMPSLVDHCCSPGHRGGFLERVQEGTLMGHVIEHVAIELQTLAGMRVEFGRTRAATKPGIYRVVLECHYDEAGRYAARAALRLCQSIIDRGYYPQAELDQDLEDLKTIARRSSLGLTTEAIVAEAQARGIPWRERPARNVVQLGQGVHQRHVQAAQTTGTGILGVEMAGDKDGTKTLLREAGIPVPKGYVIYDLDELKDAIDDIGGFPIVLKPLDGNHGRGITLNITTMSEAERAYKQAREAAKFGGVIVERFYRGNDYRVLVVNGRVVAVAERTPAHVIGDGRSTVQELIDQTNADPRRGNGHDNVLTRIVCDRQTDDMLAQQGLEVDSILATGQVCYLKATANLSTGGIAIDRTDEIHPENIWIAERAVKLVGLDIAGLDITSPDISRPLREVDGVIVEVNAAPGLRMHLQPSVGQPRNVAAPIIDMLYPNRENGRIPVISITGTNGKTTTTRLTAHLFKQTKKTVGYTTTDGTYIGDFLVEAGDNTGPQSAGLILNDPTVKVAVLETARGGILRSGLAFDACDVGVVLNVAADHLGLQDINTVEDMARVKSVIAEATRPGGTVVLNADDSLVVAMAEKVKANVAYFSLDRLNPVVWEHAKNGGLAAIYEEGYLSLLVDYQVIRVEQAVNVPLTLRGLAPFMVANALVAMLAAYTQGVSIEDISTGLRTFQASVEHTPGRMNLINLGHYHVLLDYAHNPASYQALGDVVRNWNGERIGVIGGPGDRRNCDFIQLGELSAQMFDRIIIKEDEDRRGRQRGEVAALIRQGIDQYDAETDYETILDETRAIQIAMDEAPESSLVVILPESVNRALSLIQPVKV